MFTPRLATSPTMNSPNKPLTILYRDEWLVAVHKPAGHLVHPADHPKEDDLVTMKILRDQIDHRVYNIHRIDRPTTGILLFGICRDAAKVLHRALERHEVAKTYWAVCHGDVGHQPWECHQGIQKEDNQPIRDAHTSFQRLALAQPRGLADEKPSCISLVEARPHTGRYHQIRRHLLHINKPIIGDFRYAGIDTSHHLGQLLDTGTRMLLQSKSLTFDHPVSGKQLAINSKPDPLIANLFPEYCAL